MPEFHEPTQSALLLEADDQSWLKPRLLEYEELLAYLRDY